MWNAMAYKAWIAKAPKQPMVRPTAPAKIMVLRMRSSRSPSARRTNAMRGLDVPHPFAPWVYNLGAFKDWPKAAALSKKLSSGRDEPRTATSQTLVALRHVANWPFREVM